MIRTDRGKPYWNPYVAGIAIGVLVTVAFAAGHYFGASRVFAVLAYRLRGGDVPLDHWMSWELLGLAAGGLVGALAARRFALRFERGPRTGRGVRLAAAVAGGALVMLGSRFAAGCTSGLALTGGARLSAGGFVFMAAVFVGGFAAAAAGRRLWT